MKVKQIVSESKNKKQMEVIAKEDNTLQTLHIKQKDGEWMYFAGLDKKGNKVFLPITM